MFRNYGYKVIETHLESGFNFLTDDPNFDFDIIVTNPPYSIKDDFLKRCYELNKPFALLLPITAIQGVTRYPYFKFNGIEILAFNRRVQFIQAKKVWFAVAWFCHNLLKKSLIFEELPK